MRVRCAGPLPLPLLFRRALHGALPEKPAQLLRFRFPLPSLTDLHPDALLCGQGDEVLPVLSVNCVELFEPKVQHALDVDLRLPHGGDNKGVPLAVHERTARQALTAMPSALAARWLVVFRRRARWLVL